MAPATRTPSTPSTPDYYAETRPCPPETRNTDDAADAPAVVLNHETARSSHKSVCKLSSVTALNSTAKHRYIVLRKLGLWLERA